MIIVKITIGILTIVTSGIVKSMDERFMIVTNRMVTERSKRMSDLISRQDAIDALCDNCDNVQAVCSHYHCKQYMAVEDLPSAQLEIIRCKDCKWWNTDFLPQDCGWCEKDNHGRLADWFCADGEVATVKNGDSKTSGDVK